MLENTVIKIGGSCLKSEEDFGVVADFLISERNDSAEPVPVVISAMHGDTRRLRHEARRQFPHDASLQVKHVAENGEFASVQKLCVALRDRGVSALAVDPWMLRIEAEEGSDAFNARLSGARPEYVDQFVAQGGTDFVVIPGYVGILPESNELVALGNGASDLIAVEIARHVGGTTRLIKSAGSITAVDPRLVKNPRTISRMTPEMALRMLEYMRPDDQFIQADAVRLAHQHNVVIEFGSLATPDIVSRVDPAFRPGERGDFQALAVRDNVMRLSTALADYDPTPVFEALARNDAEHAQVPFSDGRVSWTSDGWEVTIYVDADDVSEAVGRLRSFNTRHNDECGTLLTLIDTSIRPEGQHFLRAYRALRGRVTVFESRSLGVIFSFLVDDAKAAANALAEEFGMAE